MSERGSKTENKGAREKLAKELEKLKFEQAADELERIVSRIGSGAVQLDEMIELYERGVALAEHCKRLLAQYDGRIRRAIESTRTVDDEA